MSAIKNAFCRGRVFFEQFGRAYRAAREVAAAVRALVHQALLHAGPAKCALKSTDHRLGRTGRQIFVAAFAIGPNLEHQGNLLAYLFEPQLFAVPLFEPALFIVAKFGHEAGK